MRRTIVRCLVTGFLMVAGGAALAATPEATEAPVGESAPATGIAGAASDPASALPKAAVAERPAAATAAVAAPAPPAAPEVEWWQRTDWPLVIPAWLLALAAIAFALYLARLLKSNEALLADTRETSRRELRAYVALDEIFFENGDEPASAQHRLRIRNYGQTPASQMSIWCERASHLPQEGVKPFYDAPVVDGQLLHPVQAFTLGLANAPLYRIGKPGFFTYGRIIYQDIYRQWWVTKFCYRYEGDGSFVPHGDYNSEEGPFEKAPA